MTRSNKILLTVAAFGIAAAAFWFLVLSPKREEITTLDTDIATKQAEVAQAQQQLATYETARASYKKNYATLARLGKAVPADDDVRSLLVQLEATADGSGVDFEQIELGSSLAGTDAATPAPGETTTPEGELASAPGTVPVAGGALSALPFNFEFTGGFFDLSTFFARLEHFVSAKNKHLDATGRLLRIETVSISPSTAGYPDMLATVGAASYVVPPVEPVKAGSSSPDSAQNATTAPSSPGTSTTTATAGATE
ncbi:MAG TPA: type 4a pilus biogenesis protein PilO [Solirubrobacteraceae bacterium]|nr:type 4a pilus biogenesis protein PilO [Solirubrobacteraceae bacterium]